MSSAVEKGMKEIGESFDLVIKANLSSKEYQVLCREKHMETSEVSEVIHSDLEEYWNREIKRDAMPDGISGNTDAPLTIAYISDFLRLFHGKEIYWVRLIRQDGEEKIRFRLEVIAAEDYTDERQSVYVLLKNVQGMMYEVNCYSDRLLQVLSENYEAVYYVDCDHDVIRPYRINEAIDKVFGEYLRTCPSYKGAIGKYIDTIVSAKDRKEMHAVSEISFLRKHLVDRRTFSYEYRVERDGKEKIFRFKVSNMDGVGPLHHIVIGFADVTEEKGDQNRLARIGRKILVVEDNEISREILSTILEKEYVVISAENGQKAIEILSRDCQEIAVVLTDLEMPRMNGLELLARIKESERFRNIPVIVTTSSVNDANNRVAIEEKCLELGASEFILKPFVADVVRNRVRALIRLRESTAMLNFMEKDALTGLYSKEFFFRKAEQYLAQHPEEKLLMWVSDIQGLKLINEKYGFATGDEVLRVMARTGEMYIPGFLFGGRIEGDKLAALVMEESTTVPERKNVTFQPSQMFSVPNVFIKHGIYHIAKRDTLTPQGMYDRAILALQKIKNQYGVYVGEYDDEIRRDLMIKRMIAENADQALQNHQFQVYYQPKHDFDTNRTCGAEGLVRWIHPELGFMNPGDFIPLFEQNGFITKMDFYIWEEVCKTIQSWKERGIPIVPVSVNVSRRDFEVEDLAQRIIALVDSYDIAHELFHIEVTESAYTDNPTLIKKTVNVLHDNGFVIELDDFGSGYSSLMAISSLDIDILKLDKSIIQNDVPGSEKNILEFSMQLAKMMRLKTVAEGVETRQQLERIDSLGGDYMQGFYFSKPLCVQNFEKYLLK